MTSEDAFQKACISDEDNNDPTNGDGDEVSLRFKDWKHSRTMYLASVSVTKSTRAAGILSPSPSVVGADSSTQRAKKRKLRNGDAADGLGSTGCLIDIERSSLPFKSRTSSIVSSRQANRSVSKIPIELPYSPKSQTGSLLAGTTRTHFPSQFEDYCFLLKLEAKRLREDHGFFLKCLLEDQRRFFSSPKPHEVHTFRRSESILSQPISTSNGAETGPRRAQKSRVASSFHIINLSTYTSSSTKTSSKIKFRITSYQSTTSPLPKDHGYHSRLRSHVAMDCGELKYQHDDEGMDLEGIQDINEAFEDQVEEITFRNHQKELAVKYRGYALAFIEHAGSSLLQVAQYLSLHPASEDPDYQLTATILSVTENTALLSDKELKHVSLIDQALMLEFKLGMVDIFPPGCKTLITDLISACSLGVKHEATDRKRFWDLGPQALDTYINLDCLLCYRHECSEHGKLLVADDEESIIQRFSGPTYTELVSLAPELELPSHRKGRSAALLEALPSLPMKMLQSIGQKRESSTLVGPCSEECHRNQKIPSRCYLEKAREWSKGEEDLLLMSLAIYGGDTDAEWVCLLSAVTGRECIEVFKQGTKYNRPAVKDSPQPNRPRLMTHSEMKEKTVTGSHLERFGFQPCFHTGLCVQNKCSCVDLGIACEKTCFCSRSCRRRFRGCSCRRGSKGNQRICQSSRCECFDLNRECDPGLCGNCGARELLDPLNRMSKSAIYERCNNISLQKGVHKPLLVGKSELTGNGAFIAVSGEVHDFVGEYTGEIIDEQESQRRGRVYDAKGLSYIFTINKDSAIDASTFGTKVRFINHSQVRENCAPKVLFVNGMHRIGIWLKAPVKAGQELFMNYGDQFIEATADIRDFEQTKAALTAPRPKPEITRHTGRMTGQKKSGLTLRIQGSAPKPQSRSDRAKSREVRGIRTKDPSPPLSKAETDSPLSDPPTGDNSEEDKEDIRPLSHQRRS